MKEKEYKEVINEIEKYAARFKKRYKNKDMIYQYGGSADWLELTTCGIEAIKENDTKMFDWCHMYRCAQKAIQTKRKTWHNHKYKEPIGLNDRKSEIKYGHEYKPEEYTNENIIKPIIKRFCIVCGTAIYKKNKKYCSRKCQNAAFYKLKNISK